jgi:DNA-binding NarL/FixJ family response regulator
MSAGSRPLHPSEKQLPDGRLNGIMPSDHLDSTFLKSLTLLYVEDEPRTRESLGDFLRRRAGTVIVAADGAEGLAAFKEHPAQIVITDIRMPNLDGLAMAREIRSLDPGVQIIVTTAFEDADYLAQSIETEIDQYVMKPIQKARFEFALMTCVHRQRTARLSAPVLTAEERERLGSLTAREREVLGCIGRGQPSRDIGLDLGISAKTVHIHQAHLMLKLGVHKATALAAFAVRAGIA